MQAPYQTVWPYQKDAMRLPVENLAAAFAELQSNGLKKEAAGFRIDRCGGTSCKVFLPARHHQLEP